MPARRLAVLVWLGVAIAAAAARADKYDDLIPPKPQRYVTDRAGILGAGVPEQLNAKLEQFERDTSDQVLVWIDDKVPEGFTLEDFTVRAAQKWGAGQKKEDNGAVLFVFPGDRKVRIEVGYGLEGALPDVTAKRIIDDEILPRFRENDYPGGVSAGVNAMLAAVKGEYKGTGRTVDEARGRRRTSTSFGGCSPFLFFILIFIVLPMLFRRRRWRSYGGGGWWTGGGFGGFGGGGFGGGGGGGFSGGGFSGGGGSFGGGGASGSW